MCPQSICKTNHTWELGGGVSLLPCLGRAHGTLQSGYAHTHGPCTAVIPLCQGHHRAVDWGDARKRDVGALRATQQQLTGSCLWRCLRSGCWLLFALTGFEWFLIIDASFSFYLVLTAVRKGLAFLH